MNVNVEGIARPRPSAGHENARRLDRSKPPGAKIRVVVRKPLEHAEHDGPDKSDCHIRGNNAQSADESHGKPPWFTSLPTVTSKLANRSGWKKSALLLYRGVHRSEPWPMWLKIRENNVLKSP